ncbi:hypothetical protein [Cellulomonas sp.]|uniref:hypothetical protein n=1 Tax=Cellulomonas sp. TaxID=40001 RepID=UPI003BAAB0D4
MNGREHDPTAPDAMGRQPPTEGGQADGPALDTTPQDPHNGRVRRILPWVIAAGAVLVAAVTIGVLAVNESSEPAPVAQLTPQADPDQGAIPLDDETATNLGVTEADFVSYGSYGALQVWSATTPEAKRCLAMVAENRIIMVRCSAPSLDPVADLDFPPEMFPPAPSGEPTSQVRFVLRDELVEVYLAPNPEGGFY